MSNFEAKKNLVKSGKSKVFNNWNKFFSITEEEFLEKLEWVCNDPQKGKSAIQRNTYNSLTREIAIDANSDARKRADNLAMTAEQRKMFGQDYDENHCRAQVIKLRRVYNPKVDRVFYYRDDDGSLIDSINLVSINALDRI